MGFVMDMSSKAGGSCTIAACSGSLGGNAAPRVAESLQFLSTNKEFCGKHLTNALREMGGTTFPVASVGESAKQLVATVKSNESTTGRG